MQLQDKALLVKLSIGLPGNSRTDDQLTRETIELHKLAGKSGRWIKQLFPDEAYKPLVEISGEIRTWHYENSLCWQDDGYRILPTAHHTEYTNALRSFRTRFDCARDIFMAGFPEWVQWAKAAHNGTFNEAIYSRPDKIERKFRLELDFTPVPSGADFRCSIDQTELASMAAKVDARIQEATEAARLELWRRLVEPLRAMQAKLSEPDRANGASPIFRDTLISNLQDIAKLIPQLNLTADAQLSAFAAEVQFSVASLQPDSLRQSKQAREDTAKRAADILARMSGYLPTPTE